jgi:hypothetical protein
MFKSLSRLLRKSLSKINAEVHHQSNRLMCLGKLSDVKPKTARLNVENLEDRLTPTGNLAITSLSVVDANDQPITTVTTGEAVYVQATFTTQGLATNANYRIGYTVNGITKNTDYLTWGAGNSGVGNWYAYWGTWTAETGINQVTVILDPDDSASESSYSDNTASMSFTGVSPIAITGTSVVNGNAQPITYVTSGQSVYIEADFATQGLPNNASYVVSYTCNGNTKTTGSLTWGAGSAGTSYWYAYWGTWKAIAGMNQVTIDIQSSTTGVVYSSTSFSFAAVSPIPAAASLYSPVTGTLFGPNGPSYLDVEQGALGDCWLISSLAEVAARDPQDIVNMFTYDGTAVDDGSVVSLYTVRFFNNAGKPEYVTIDTQLPGGGSVYDHPLNSVLWVALAEKAYAVANNLNYVESSNVGKNSYGALNGGWPSWALHAITGGSASDNPLGNVAAAWNSGQFIVRGQVTVCEA